MHYLHFTNGETETQTSLAHYSTASGVGSGIGAHGLKGMGYVFLTTQLVHLGAMGCASCISFGPPYYQSTVYPHHPKFCSGS